ncbi:hypothetical protein JYU34_018027 [Plutella xylostella]|uniref:Protein kinase domain-containing protein n=1 Tax=Plutella xylostella TaxID=51655 RepID=A0ABQ7PZU0_PLUXY|nr:hypothetical protein JYU34_018027 [Plutella xylostella]
MLAACTGLTLTCGTHGNVRLSDVAPDTLFLDVEESMRARWDDITVGGVAGRGAFGTVYRGKWRGQAVAVKALQPIPGSKQGGKHMQAAASRWERDPASGACRAYCALRQELGVLRALRHAGVVPLRAVCAAPLALLTPLAPMGALDGVLLQYRSVGSRVGARAGRRLVLHVARAIEYLHASRTVYRDLKSENVLVWAMPTPQEAAAAELSPNPVNVHIKLGDYGISRIAPPSGTKGFGGTEGFMAPEIMRYNGEEEYNEKVDCFSFGMLLYEVLTLRQPFEGHEAVKEAVLDGARPALNARDLQSPISFLALMRQCWSGRPSARPSAAALVSVAAAPEMPALQDAAATRASQGWLAFGDTGWEAWGAGDAGRVHTVTATHAHFDTQYTVTMSLETIHPSSGDTGWEAWGAGDAGRVHTVTATHAHFDTQYTVTMPLDNDKPVSVASMCRVGSKVWIGDSSGRLSVYSSSTCTLQWTVRVQDLVGGSPAAVSALAPLLQLSRVAVALECGRASPCTLQWTVRVQDLVGGSPAAVSALAPLPQLSRVAVALECGRLFLVTSSQPQVEGSFVVTELGAATELTCLAAVASPTGYEVFAGGSGLDCYSVRAGGVSAAASLPAPGRVTSLAAAPTAPTVLFVSEPACVVYGWCLRRGTIASRLDCSKLAPCSESLQSIALDDTMSELSHTVRYNIIYVHKYFDCSN